MCECAINRQTPGQQVRPVRKCMGLRPGEKLDVLRDPLEGKISVEIPQSSAVRFEPVGASAAAVLCAAGILKGAHGLEGLLNADARAGRGRTGARQDHYRGWMSYGTGWQKGRGAQARRRAA